MNPATPGSWSVTVQFHPVDGEPYGVTHVVNDAVAANVEDFAAMSAQIAYDKVVEALFLQFEREVNPQSTDGV